MLNIVRLTPNIGAEIRDLDLSKLLDEATMKEIRAVLDEYGVVTMRGQKLSTEDFMRFSRGIGTLAVHSLKQFSKPGMPELMVASNIVENGKPIGLVDGGQVWHTDGSYLERPYRATILYSLEIPVKDGKAIGDTMFASTTAAYDALTTELKKLLQGMRAVHRHGVGREKKGVAHKLDESQRKILEGIEHPIVRTHPRTGRKCIYVNRGCTDHIVGKDETACAALLEALEEHIVRPEFVYRHNWRVGDILMWDNCSTQHNAIGDYELPQRRLIHRTVVEGEAVF